MKTSTEYCKNGIIPIFKITSALIFTLLMLSAVNAYTTNSSGKIFSFAVTSGKNNEINSSTYKSYVALGDITGALGSSNFQTELGFMGTAFRIDGDSCTQAAECAGGLCCSSICSHTNCPTSQSSPAPASEGGGSAAGTPQLPAPANSYTYILDSVKSNEQTAVNINRVNLPIIKMLFTLKESLEQVALSLAQSDSPSSTIQYPIQYLEISSDKINKNNILSFKIQFKVRKDAGYIKETVALNQYETEWVKLPTSLTGEDNDYYYYESSTTGFSLFAITGEKNPTATAAQITNQTVVKTPQAAEEIVKPLSQLEKNASKALQSMPKTAEKKKLPYGMLLLLFEIIAGALALLSFFTYYMPKLKLRHVKMMYGNFNKLLASIIYDLNAHKVYEATKIYYQLLQSYKELMKYPLKKETKFQVYLKIKNIYEQLARMRKDGAVM